MTHTMTSARRAKLALAAAALAGAAALAAVPAPAAAQITTGRSERGQPRTPFSTSDLAKLRWLEGAWSAVTPDEPPLYERFHFVDDSTIDVSYYRDPALHQETGSGRIYLTVGRIYHTFGAGRWGATHLDEHGAYFIPQVASHTSFAWAFQDPNHWTITMRSGMSGREHITVYDLTRLGS